MSKEKQTRTEIQKLGRLFRDVAITRDGIDEEARTVPVAFSSEEPYLRWDGYEILEHSEEAVNLDRFKDNRAPILMDHDTRDQVGVAEDVSIGSDRVGRAVARFGKSARAEEIFQDVKDGIRSQVSVGYVVNHMRVEEAGDDGPDTYRVDSWTPLEISFVSVPADTSVGVGRGDESDDHETTVELPIKQVEKEASKMPDTKIEVSVPTEAEIQSRIDKAAGEQAEKECNRRDEINAVAAKWNCADLAIKAISENWSAARFKGEVLTSVVPDGQELFESKSDLGLSEKETREFSIWRGVKAAKSGNWEGAEFERECSNEIAKRNDKAARGIYVPLDVQKRDLLVGTDTLGGFLKGTTHMGSSFIELLHNRQLVRNMGAMVLSGLRGDVAIPKLSAGATGAWVGENSATTETDQTFASVTLAPKAVTAWTDISRSLQLQSDPVVDAIIAGDLSGALARSIDLAALHGTGSSNQPTGVASTSGIGSVVGGTNGAAPDWHDIVDLETAVAVDNADVGSLAYITNAKVRGKLKKTETVSGSGKFVWDGSNDLNGYTGAVTNQVSSTLTKGTSSGVCSAIFFGNWADLMIGEWGNLDVLIDPYTGGTAGTLRIIVFQDVDIAVRHAESFAAMLDALTT